MRHSRQGWAVCCAATLIGCGSGTTAPNATGADAGPDSGALGAPFHVARLATPVSKVDLLVMVDDSASMADKFDELARRMPVLVKALTSPDPDPSTGKPKYLPVRDLHVGVITSSLGGHGTSVCDAATNPHADDHGHLMPRVGENGTHGYTVAWVGGPLTEVACPAPVAASALSWAYDPSGATARFAGTSQSGDMQAAVACVVQSVGEDGCGYEAQLESVYHFLVDPAPYLTADIDCVKSPTGDDCGQNVITPKGVDQVLLQQRAAFLRPDSVLAVVMLTDENDASLRPAPFNSAPLVLAKGAMPLGWKACENVPDDFEPEAPSDFARLNGVYGCWSCVQSNTDPGGNCSATWPTAPMDVDVDGRNLRMFQQTRRYGYNFLWGRQRYVDAFSAARVPGSDGVLAPNPIFAGGVRTKDLVVVAGILGVPRKLLPTTTNGKLVDLTEADWDKIVSPDLGKRDPHMIEQIAPRTDHGVPLFAGDRSVDPVNGGDRHVVGGDDLQYACIAPRAVATATPDCAAPNADAVNPLCQSSGGTMTQPYFKAYPTLRELRVLHELGAAGVQTAVSSICDASYEAGIEAISAKLVSTLRSAAVMCLPSPPDFVPIAVKDGGFISCAAFEVFASDRPRGATSCEALVPGRPGYCTPGAEPCGIPGTILPPISAASIASTLSFPYGAAGSSFAPRADADGNVYLLDADGVRHLVCEIAPIDGNPAFGDGTQASCMTDPTFAAPAGSGGGWCWTNEPAVAASCGSAIRLIGDVTPHAGSTFELACLDERFL